MKTISILLITGLTVISACSSPKQRHEQRQVDAKARYNQDLKQSQEQYETDEMNVKRKQAKEMIDDSESVNVNKDKGQIQVEE